MKPEQTLDYLNELSIIFSIESPGFELVSTK